MSREAFLTRVRQAAAAGRAYRIEPRGRIEQLHAIVDGFFNFLVGVLLVALTDNWQRLGDLAARTLVVTDDDRPPAGMPSGMPPDPR